MGLAELRKAKSMTQANLAELLGVKQQSVHAIETGATRPSIEVAKRIMIVFGLSVGEVWAMFYADQQSTDDK